MASLRLSPLLAMLGAHQTGKSGAPAKEKEDRFFKALTRLLESEAADGAEGEQSALLKLLQRHETAAEGELPIDFAPQTGERAVPETAGRPSPDTFEKEIEEKKDTPLQQIIVKARTADRERMTRIPVPADASPDPDSADMRTETVEERRFDDLPKIREALSPHRFTPLFSAQPDPKEERANRAVTGAARQADPSTKNPREKPLPELFGRLLSATEKAKADTGSKAEAFKASHRLSLETLQRTLERETTVHDLKTAKSIEALIDIAKKANLEPRRILFEKARKAPVHSKEAPPAAIPERYPEQSAHLSRSVASLLHAAKTNRQEVKKSAPLPPDTAETPSAEGAKNDAVATVRSRPEPSENPLKTLMQLVTEPKRPVSAERKTTARGEIAAETENSAEKKEAQRISVARESIDTETGPSERFHLETHKANETLQQKIVDAKATVRHFARTLQEQVEHYRPPFARMKLTLEPKELGAVELTMVSRGNNLHIQVHSNPGAIGIMATQGQELKNQLVSMGFTDVQMQFNMNQQQQQQQRRHGGRSGASYGMSGEMPEFYESLDIMLPQYV